MTIGARIKVKSSKHTSCSLCVFPEQPPRIIDVYRCAQVAFFTARRRVTRVSSRLYCLSIFLVWLASPARPIPISVVCAFPLFCPTLSCVVRPSCLVPWPLTRSVFHLMFIYVHQPPSLVVLQLPAATNPHTPPLLPVVTVSTGFPPLPYRPPHCARLPLVSPSLE